MNDLPENDDLDGDIIEEDEILIEPLEKLLSAEKVFAVLLINGLLLPLPLIVDVPELIIFEWLAFDVESKIIIRSSN